MSIETKVEGNPDQITSLATWLTSSLEPAVSTSGDKLSSAKKDLGSEWQGQTADAIVKWLADAVSASDSLSTRITDIATALTTYNLVLSSVRTEAECVRNDATSGGLTVNGTVVQEPKNSSDTTKTHCTPVSLDVCRQRTRPFPPRSKIFARHWPPATSIV